MAVVLQSTIFKGKQRRSTARGRALGTHGEAKRSISGRVASHRNKSSICHEVSSMLIKYFVFDTHDYLKRFLQI